MIDKHATSRICWQEMIDYIVGLDFKLYLVFCALKQVREVSIVITRIKYMYMAEFEYLLICSKSGVKSKRLLGKPTEKLCSLS